MSLEEMRRRFVECGEELPRGGLMLLEADRRAGAREVAARVWRRIGLRVTPLTEPAAPPTTVIREGAK